MGIRLPDHNATEHDNAIEKESLGELLVDYGWLPTRVKGDSFVDSPNSSYNNSFGSTGCNWVGGVLDSNLCRVLLATSVVHSGAYRTPSGCGYQRTNSRQHDELSGMRAARHGLRPGGARSRWDQRPANQGPTAPEDAASYR